jgi:hypothetical protein
MKNFLKISFFVTLGCFFSACEDVISVKLDQGVPQMVVDAFINDLPQTQTIKLSLSGKYFDQSLPTPIPNAAVKVINHGTDSTFNQILAEYVFVHSQNGNYNYAFDSTNRLGKVGDYFSLEIVTEKGKYSSKSRMNRVPALDSLVFLDKKTVPYNFENGFVAQFWATDFEGIGDTYWVKTFKNNRYIDDPEYINAVYDAAFDGGSLSDGLTFIFPIRFIRINYVDPKNPENGPYQPGDTVRVEIHSIPNEVHRFLRQAAEQLTNGGLFATPPYNVLTNIESQGEKALGIFCVSSVSWLQNSLPK